MQLQIYKDYEDLSFHVAAGIIELVKTKPAAVLCVASGHTPTLAYAIMAEKAAAEKIDFSQCTFIELDEWVGIEPGKEGSCEHYLQANIFKPLHISATQMHLFNGLSADLENECSAMNQAIADKGGIDLMLVGVGMNGHIGFNEPGVSFDNNAHVIDLDETTRSVGQKYFTQRASLHQGITLGLRQLMEARKVIVMANGVKKAEVIRKALEEEITNRVPASIIRNHSNGFVMIDEEAASLLKQN